MYIGSWVNVEVGNKRIFIVAGGRGSPGLLAPHEPAIGFDVGEDADLARVKNLARSILFDYLQDDNAAEFLCGRFATEFLMMKLASATKWELSEADLRAEITRLNSQSLLPI